MILCDSEIRAALRHQQVIIEPNPPVAHISTSAVDLMLGTEFKRWQVPQEAGIDISIDPSQPDIYPNLASQYLAPVPLEADGSVVVKPGGFMLALTHERIELPKESRLAARVEGRSTLARLGLGVHVTAPTIHAGFRGHVTLEITNLGPLPIRLRPELRICQLVLEQVFGTPSVDMEGVFQDQTSVAGHPPG